MLESIRQIHARFPSARFLVASYRDQQCLWCRDYLTEADASIPLEFYVGRTSEIIQAARCSMMVSGSVSLEMMARRTPAAVVYRVGRLVHTLAKLLVRIDSITLPNLMDQRKVFPEYVSVGRTEPAVEFLSDSIGAMLGDSFYFSRLKRQLDELCGQHARAGASARAAGANCPAIGRAECHAGS